METATGARTQPLMWAITTAGFNRAGICYEQRTYSTKILNGAIRDETFFATIWTIEDGDDWSLPETWAKANPNWGVSVNPEDIARKAKKAMEMAAAQNNFLTKHLNVWVNADIAWMDMRRWDRQGTAEGIENYYGRRAWLALDLATKTDIAALCILVDIGDGKFATFARYYLPEEAVEDGRNSQYSGWAIEEWLTTTYGATTDFGTIERDILTICDQFRVVNCVYDPWQGAYIAQRLTELNVPMAEYRHTVKNMSFAMKELEARIYDKRLIHDGNPVTTWMMSNVVAHLDAKDEIYPRKTDPSLKIDGIVALIMATGQSTVQETDSVYETRGIRTL
jgi:phage terminase large subunit-like protein